MRRYPVSVLTVLFLLSALSHPVRSPAAPSYAGKVLTTADYLYNIAQPDGLTLGIFNRAIPFAQLTKLPGVMFDVLLSDGFAKVTKDPEMQEDARKSSLEVQYTSGPEIMKVISSVFHQPPEIIAEFSRHVKF